MSPPPPRGNSIIQGGKLAADIQYYGWFSRLVNTINQLIAGGGGGGGITEITSTGGTVTITDPTGPTVNLEVDGTLTVTDGTHTVSPVSTLDFAGAVVSGTSPNATVTIGGGFASQITTITQAGGASQTYNVPTGATTIEVYLIGGGGGGGSGPFDTTGVANQSGGGGGGAGARVLLEHLEQQIWVQQ